MTRLTEEMVVARSRQSDLGSIKKLNCWGSDLSDVSIIKRMRGVEVLALSVNKIASLAPFENCSNLQELYLRKNEIQDINEIAYLQSLPNLKSLWLEENPLCDNVGPNYRQIVLRALPNLKKLDNIDVTVDEVQEAMRAPIEHNSQQQQPEDVYEDAREQQNQRRSQSPKKEIPSPDLTEECVSESNNQSVNQSIPSSSSPLQRSSPSHPPSPVSANNNTNIYNNKENRMSFHQYDRSPGSDQDSPINNSGGAYQRGPLPPSISTHSMKEYYQSDYQKQAYPQQYRHSQTDLTTEWEESQQNSNQYGGGGGGGGNCGGSTQQRRSAGTEREERYNYRNGNPDWEEGDRRRRPEGRFSDTASTVSTVLNHYHGLHRRPINRSSNLLSATLCLVKELDYPSLEVVEHAVRCRIDELAGE